MTNFSDIVILPLRAAILCVDCLAISNTPNSFCPACCGTALFSLAVILERPEKQEVPHREYAHA